METIIATVLGNFDLSEKHLIKVTVNSIDPTDEDVEEYFKTYNEILENEVKGDFISIVDGKNAQWINGQSRVNIGKGTKILQEKYKDRYKNAIFVVTHAVAQMMLKGVNIAAKPVVPQKVFSDMDSALIFAKEEIANWK